MPCDDCHEYFSFYSTIDVFNLRAGVFFTEKACQEHIDQNDYHYNKPRVFAVSAWRNYEMQEVMQHISALTTEDNKPVSFYR